MIPCTQIWSNEYHKQTPRADCDRDHVMRIAIADWYSDWCACVHIINHLPWPLDPCTAVVVIVRVLYCLILFTVIIIVINRWFSCYLCVFEPRVICTWMLPVTGVGARCMSPKVSFWSRTWRVLCWGMDGLLADYRLEDQCLRSRRSPTSQTTTRTRTRWLPCQPRWRSQGRRQSQRNEDACIIKNVFQ